MPWVGRSRWKTAAVTAAATDRFWGGGAVLMHAGSNTMWYCVAWVAPKRDFAVLAAANLGGDDASQACDEAAVALIQVHEQRAR